MAGDDGNQRDENVGKRLSRVGAMAVFNVLAWLAMLVFVFQRLKWVGLFTFAATTRSTVSHNYTAAQEALDTWHNISVGGNPFSGQNRAVLGEVVLNAAGCSAVSGGIGVSWSGGELSPLCDCIEAVAVERVLAFVGGNSSRVADLEAMTVADVNAVLANLTSGVHALLARLPTLEEACSGRARPTQVEHLAEGRYWGSTNVVLSTLAWSAVAAIASLFAWIGTGSGESPAVWGMLRADASILLSLAVTILTGAAAGTAAAGGEIIASVLVTTILACVLSVVASLGYSEAGRFFGVKRSTAGSGGGVVDIVQSTMCSLSFAVGVWSAWGTLNAATQRRDYHFGIATTALAMAMAALTYVVRFVHHGIVSFNSKNKLDGAYERLFSLVWFSNVATAAVLVGMPGTGFDAGPLSNTSHVALGVVAILLLYPLLVEPHRAGEGKAEEPGVSANNVTYMTVDLVARGVMVAAVGLDLMYVNRAD